MKNKPFLFTPGSMDTTNAMFIEEDIDISKIELILKNLNENLLVIRQKKLKKNKKVNQNNYFLRINTEFIFSYF